MKSLLITAIAALLLVGCGESQQSTLPPEEEPAHQHAAATQPEPLAVKAPEANSDKEKALELLFGTNSTITEKDEAFLSAAKKGKLDEVKSLLAEGVDVDCSDAFSCTGLFWAAANNHKSIVEYLIEKGANLNAGAGIGGTPLARAAYEGHVEVVELLLTKGADVNAKDVSGRSPLDSADESVVDLLRKHGDKTGAELKAVGKAIKPVAEAAKPEPPTAKAPDASLWEAAMSGEIELAKKAIADGANVNAKKEDGQTPLHFAVVAALDSGDNKVIELLIENGADVNAKIVSGRHQGMTPLDITGGLSEAATLTKRLRELQGKTDDIPVADLLRKHGGKTGEELKGGNRELAKKSKVTSFKSMPEIDLSSFTEDQQTTILARANKEGCDCGCSMTVAQCRNDDQTCGKGMALAKAIVKDVTGVDIKVAVAKPKADNRIGKPVDIKFTSIDGKKINVSDMKGKVVLIDFWATWCGPCVAEIPNVKRTYDKLHPKGFEIVGISLDSKESALRRFVKEKEMPWPQYFDGKGWKNSISTAHGIRSIPAMWLVDKQGNLADLNARRDLEGKVEELLAAPSPEAN
jgi:ankyrin repeat protein/thiol-disulfide isomerase/thioredoxin|tara:strand:+ start:357 stop:2090 length:1734 start_codon:yes stop_codon:yes gene_type:complete